MKTKREPSTLVETFGDLASAGVVMLTHLRDAEVVYEVIVGTPIHDADRGDVRTAWSKTVAFGATDRTVAGGMAFREAAREQEAVAWELFHAARLADPGAAR